MRVRWPGDACLVIFGYVGRASRLLASPYAVLGCPCKGWAAVILFEDLDFLRAGAQRSGRTGESSLSPARSTALMWMKTSFPPPSDERTRSPW